MKSVNESGSCLYLRGGLTILNSNTILSRYVDTPLDLKLSFEIQFVLSTNGCVLEYNHNATPYVERNGDIFFDHFSKEMRDQAYLFIRDILHQTDVIEKTLWQKNGEHVNVIKYRGMMVNRRILLTGIEIQNIAKPLTRMIPPTAEFIFKALNISVLIYDFNKNRLYCNDKDLIKKGKTAESTEEKGQSSVLPVIENMHEEIIANKTSSQRFHVNEESLYHIQGLYLSDWKQIIYLIDNRTRSDEFDSLIKHGQQMESVSHLAAGFAHELRNPLSVIRGFIQLSGLTNNIGKYYNTILSEIDRMNNIVEDFLSLSRKTSRKDKHIPFKLFQSLIPLIRSECILRKIDFHYHFERTTRLLYIDGSMIKQIVLNLLRNSVEAFDPDQEKKAFQLTTKMADDSYVITVKDNGPGMEESVLEQLGKPFFTTKENGTGIGLPLCKKIVEDHHGSFSIESKLGEGTTIIFSLPFPKIPIEDIETNS